MAIIGRIFSEGKTLTHILSRQPNFSVVPPEFNRLLFCETDVPHAHAFEIVYGYDPDDVAGRPDFLNYLSDAYTADKADTPPVPEREEPKEPTLDLRNPEHLNGMISHTLTHAVSGWLDGGVSNTDCIPYWDRAAVIAGLLYANHETAYERLAVVDALSLNALRAYCSYLGTEAFDRNNRSDLIVGAMLRGQTSKLSMVARQQARLELNEDEFALAAGTFVAKLKHLMWLTDAQTNPKTRQFVSNDIRRYIEHATMALGLDPEDLTIDMGIDTGMSADSQRPAYDISMFVQLRHLFKPGKKKIHALPQAECQRLSVADLLTSIHRSSHDLPWYEKGSPYHMPFRF